MSGNIQVEVAYALPGKQRILTLDVADGTTAIEAVRLSGIDRHFEDLDLHKPLSLGVFGKVVAADQRLLNGDRVEIYRPLKVDPKEVRKRRAEEAKQRREVGEA